MTKQSKFPPGWDEERVKRVLKHYGSQSEEEAVAEDEAALASSSATVMNVPKKSRFRNSKSLLGAVRRVGRGDLPEDDHP